MRVESEFRETTTQKIIEWDQLFGGEPPDENGTEAELFVAGALSTIPPFSRHYPTYALPFAKAALEALGKWEPSDDRPLPEP